MLKKYYQVQMLDSLNTICETQRKIADSIIHNDNEVINKSRAIITNQQTVVMLKDHEIGNLNLVITDQKKTIRRQKLYKWFATIGGGTVSSFLGYKYITKIN